MSQGLHNGFIFEKGVDRYLVVIETGAGKYWGVTAVQHNGGRFYSDNGDINFPIDAPYACFSLISHRLADLLDAPDCI